MVFRHVCALYGGAHTKGSRNFRLRRNKQILPTIVEKLYYLIHPVTTETMDARPVRLKIERDKPVEEVGSVPRSVLMDTTGVSTWYRDSSTLGD